MAEELTLEDRIAVWQRKIEVSARRVGKGSFSRIIKFARKPTPQEFRRTMLVCGIGMLFMGFVGFVVFYLMTSAADDVFKPAWAGIKRAFGF